MRKIECPNCGKTFEIDDNSYAQLLNQVRTNAFEQELHARARLQEQQQKLVLEKALLEQELMLKEDFDREKRELKTELDYYKDLKLKQSTKMVGENLEQHCLLEFESLRSAAFPNASFEKDNDARSGSKGDFIFREKDGGIEFISIMFEMKNEMDETATKHKNDQFFKELDKDRKEKHCEYAVLVSTLESDSELYNRGIVDVSHRYPKMYVVRPQFFIPIITLLRNAARNSLEDKRQLQIAREQQIDITNFEANLSSFKDGVGKSYDNASKKLEEAIDGIDKTIKKLESIKEALRTSENHLATVNRKVDDITVRRLTKNAPSVAQMIRDARNQQLEEAGEVIVPDAVF